MIMSMQENAIKQNTAPVTEKRRSTIVISVVLAFAIVLCILVIGQVLSKGYVSLGGYSLFRVVTGSMEPSIPVGAVLIAKDTPIQTVEMPNFYDKLPQELWKYTVGEQYDATNPQESLKKGAGAGHHGSHAHMVHEFVRSVIEGRKAWINEELAANITAAGLCAHESALRDGEWVTIPRF